MDIIKKTEIRTERLILKSILESDIYRLSEILGNKEIAKTFMLPVFENEEDILKLANKIVVYSSIDNNDRFEYGIYYDNQLIGTVNDCGYDDNEIEIGYFIHPDYWNRGFMTEALKAIIRELFDMNFKRVITGCFIENIASARVMEKAGMTRIFRTDEIEYRGVIHKCIYYSASNTLQID